MQTKPARLRLLIVLPLLAFVLACAPKPETLAGIETEKTICGVWQEGIPSRSRKDTMQTQTEIGEHYDDFLAACHPLPLPF